MSSRTMPHRDSNADHTSRPPHVVWLMCDQLRADALGFAGNAHVRTPNLDRLAARGVVFDQMYPQSSVCVPSRACMITGRYMRPLGMSGGASMLNPRETTLPEVLQQRGYRTSLFGKLHLTPQQYTLSDLGSDCPVNDARPFVEPAGIPPAPERPEKQHYGFQDRVEIEDTLRGQYVDWLMQRDPALAQRVPRDRASAMNEAPWRQLYPDSPLRDVGPVDMPAELHPSMFVGESAADYFAQHHAETPLFMQVSFVDPHHPFDPPEEIARDYPAERMPSPKYTDTGAVTWPAGLAERVPDFSDVTDEMARTTVGLYYAMVEMIDRGVGRLLEAIERAGEMDNTVFVFVADHGEMLGDYGLWRKGSYHYDCLIRVPCFVSWPAKLPQGQRIDELTQAIDLMPTLLGLLGVDAPPGVQGRDLSTRLVQGESVGRPFIYCELFTAWWGPFVACWTVRTAEAKLNYFPDDRVGHLFDLRDDPDERVDRYDDPASRALRDQMMTHLLTSMHEQTDPLPRVLSQF
ncbi:MAG: sulfatase [Phycisphaeraceae bacterium]